MCWPHTNCDMGGIMKRFGMAALAQPDAPTKSRRAGTRATPELTISFYRLWKRRHHQRNGHAFSRSTALEVTHQISSQQAVPNSYLTSIGSKQNTIFSSSLFGLPGANDGKSWVAQPMPCPRKYRYCS